MTIDELIPCYARGEPIFAKCTGGELWVPLLEKAYAKLHGGYHQLRGGSVSEALADLTGSPTASYELHDENMRELITKGHFWRLMEHYKAEGFLLAFESDPIPMWTTRSEILEQEKKQRQ